MRWQKVCLEQVKLVFIILLMGAFGLGCGANTDPPPAEAVAQEEIIRNFIAAINDKDSAAAEAMLAPNAVYIENSADGSRFTEEDIAEIKLIIQQIIDNDTRLAIAKIEQAGGNTWKVAGTDSDYLTDILEFNEGISFQSTYILQDGKIRSAEFTYGPEEEVLEQKIAGVIGIGIDADSDEISVSEVLAGMPAEKAGLKAGDRIEAVDGLKVADMQYGRDEVFYRIRGPVGSQVKLTVNRDGRVFAVDVERAAQVQP